MADSGFPLPGSSYRELIKIIQGYGRMEAMPLSLTWHISQRLARPSSARTTNSLSR